MSLINDALKQAKQSQSPHSPGGVPPLPPVKMKSQGNFGWVLILSVILFVLALFFFAGSSLFKHKKIPAPMTKAPASTETQTGLPQKDSPKLSVDAAAETTGQWPKVQGIIYDAAQPMAIVDRQTVRIGDHAGDYKITAISRMSVTFQRADGSVAEIKITGQ